MLLLAIFFFLKLFTLLHFIFQFHRMPFYDGMIRFTTLALSLPQINHLNLASFCFFCSLFLSFLFHSRPLFVEVCFVFYSLCTFDRVKYPHSNEYLYVLLNGLCEQRYFFLQCFCISFPCIFFSRLPVALLVFV